MHYLEHNQLSVEATLRETKKTRESLTELVSETGVHRTESRRALLHARDRVRIGGKSRI